MPVKRRLDKSRHLDAYRREMLRYGPHSVLIAGVGYLAEVGAGIFATATPEQQRAIMHTMRADWQRHSERLLAEGGDWWAEQITKDRA
jgi:hypothetical protein